MEQNNSTILSKIFKLIFIGLMVLAIAFLAKTYAFFKVNAEKLEIFNSITDLEQSHQPNIKWVNQTDVNGLLLDRFNKREIELALSSAWNLLNQSVKHKRSIGLADRFSDTLKNQIILGLEKDSNILIQQIDLQHELDLHLFSFNRQLIAFKDKNVRIYKESYQIIDGVKHLLQKFEVINDYEIVMVLDDGKWKIQEWLKTNSRVNTNNKSTPINYNNALRAINYYPQATPWLEFWKNYSDSITNKDLQLIKELGFNSTRIFIPYELFGKGKVNTKMLDKLQNYLDQSEKKDMKVMVTLFDFPQSYNIEVYPSTRNHLISILSRFKEHEAIAAWDIKNEPDLDFEGYGKTTVTNWLEFMLKEGRTISPNQAFTIGWSNQKYASILDSYCDIISFHYYDEAEDLGQKIIELRSLVNGKPIMLSEFGRTSYNAWYGPFGFTENEQAKYAQDIYKVLSQNEIEMSAYWTLYDFPTIEGSIFGWKPWINKSQQKFGLIGFYGQMKKATQAISNKKTEIALTISDKIKKWILVYLLLFILTVASLFLLKKILNSRSL